VTLEVRPFGEEDRAAAAVLLADRHRRHRAAEPLLPAAYEEPDAAGAQIEALWRGEGVTGAAAVRDGRLVGYMLGAPRADPVWGPNGWVELAGHAAADPEDVRDLYAAISQGWVDDGRMRHFALVPATGAALLDAWFRLSFGQQQAYGIRAVDPVAGWPAGVRHAEPRDIDALVAAAPLVSEHQERAPTFAFRPHPDDPDELRADIEHDIESPEIGCLVTEIDGAVVGCLVVCPVEMSTGMHVGLARPPGESYLAWAGALPGARGRGVGGALTEAAHAWAREAGYATMVIDWRVANLLASRFWLRRGFRPTFLRLSRTIA
jgi:ribosomal protein S18 acetylase RimI-like enzyme